MLTPAMLPCPSTPGRLVRVDDDTVWADTGTEWREATEEEILAARELLEESREERKRWWQLL